MGTPVFAPQMLRKDIRGEFIEALMTPRAPLLIDRIATIMPSDSDKENYGWLSEPYEMSEIIDEMPINPLTDTGLTPQTGSDDPGYEVKNKTFGGALLFRRDDLADEKVGGYRQRIEDAAAKAFAFPDVRLIEKLVAGESDTSYIQVGATGEAFFSNAHAARGAQTSTWSNLLSGNGTSVANCQTDIGAAIAALYNMRDEGNSPMNRFFKQLYCLFPPAMEVSIRTAILAQVISQTSNVAFAPTIEPISEPLLTATDANDYYVGILDAPVRGLMWQEREGVMLEEVGEGSELWTNQRQVEYATTRRGEAAFGRPQRLIKITNT